jgi:hypothetical protein
MIAIGAQTASEDNVDHPKGYPLASTDQVVESTYFLGDFIMASLLSLLRVMPRSERFSVLVLLRIAKDRVDRRKGRKKRSLFAQVNRYNPKKKRH